VHAAGRFGRHPPPDQSDRFLQRRQVHVVEQHRIYAVAERRFQLSEGVDLNLDLDEMA